MVGMIEQIARESENDVGKESNGRSVDQFHFVLLESYVRVCRCGGSNLGWVIINIQHAPSVVIFSIKRNNEEVSMLLEENGPEVLGEDVGVVVFRTKSFNLNESIISFLANVEIP